MGRSPALVWCPECEDWQHARSINAPDYCTENARQDENGGIRYHQRYRQCQTCDLKFFTVEFTKDELTTLLRDRDSLASANAKLDGVRKGLRATLK